MKRYRVQALCLLLAAALALTGCAARRGGEDTGKLQVVCTLFPYYDFVRAIGGDRVEPYLLVTAGREAHSFEPTPLDVIRISQADVFICNGGESETWVDDILDAAGESIGSVVHMMDHAHVLGEEFSEGMQGGHDHDEHAHDEHDGHDHDGHEEEIEYDEHIWTSPRIAMDLCRVIADTLAQADPAHAQEYQDRLAAYLRELTDLDRAFRDTVEAGQRHLLVFGDRFPLLYFCREYGLDYRAAFHGCSGDTEPSLATLKYLIDKVNQEDIPVVYTIELSSRKVANAIAETTGAQVLTFQVRRGDYLCIVGDNGSGKSTLLKSMLGLLRPLSGEIRLDESLRRGAIGYLPQQTRAQKDFPATVSEVVLSGFLSARGWKFFYTPAQKSQALQHMGKLGILELKDKCYRELSGGQQQRVLLARALCAAGDLLVLDEPVTGLDPAAADDLYRTLRYLNRTEGMAVVMVTHDIRSALRDAAAILHAGRDQWFLGTPGEYLASPYGKRFGGDLS